MKCNGCDQEMTDNVACTVEDYDDFADGNARARIPNAEPGNCHDCGTPAGALHHPGCDAERCPACAGQAISCGCGEAKDEDEDEDAGPRRGPLAVLTLGRADPMPAIAATLTGVRIDPLPRAPIAAIVKDDAGRIVGYVTQSEVDRIRAAPSAVEVRGMAARFESMIDAGRRNMDALQAGLAEQPEIVHDYAAAGYTVCGLETGGGISRGIRGYDGPRPRTTTAPSAVTCPACREGGKL